MKDGESNVFHVSVCRYKGVPTFTREGVPTFQPMGRGVPWMGGGYLTWVASTYLISNRAGKFLHMEVLCLR